jgi:signal transduction histidine kinase
VTVQDITTIIFSIESGLYFLLTALVWRKSDSQEQTRRALMLYLAISGLWTLVLLTWHLGWPDTLAIKQTLLDRIPLYGLLVLALLLLHLTRSFLRQGETRRRWPGLVAAWVAVLVVLDGNLLSLSQEWWTGGGRTFGLTGFSLGVLAAGWGVFMGAAVVLITHTYRQSRQPLHRNRIKYWGPALVAAIAGDLLSLAGYLTLGSGLRFLGALVAAYAAVTHHLPDVRQTMRRVISYVLITLLTVIIYTAGFATMQYLFEALPGYSPVLAGAAMALILAILFQPLLRAVQRLVHRLLFGSGYDPRRTLRQYSTSISNILDLGLLSNVMVKLVGEAMNIRHGRLFLVDYAQGPDEKKAFRLRDVGGGGASKAVEGILSADSPATEHLHRQRLPLTQYDIDLLPRFQILSEAERDWLAGLDTDVYVPIHAKGEWMGLLALGPKVSGDRYFDDDLVLLNTLADQTAVALENARLVDNLVQANTELGRAYADLNKANRQLQELDKLKSAFIGVITHELRTPYANLLFSLELLERHGRQHLPQELHEQLDQLTGGVKAAKTMVDNLVTFSTFFSKQGELRPTQLDFGQLVTDSLAPLRPLAEAKQITFHIHIPATLPPVRGDPERLADAIHHLVHNAIKFTAPGGAIWIRCRAENSTVRFEVKDTGVGVPADKLPTLWEDFAQMADPLRRGVEGLGLGLALVRYVVNAHSGEVWAESQAGVGSTFGFHIPLGGV